MLSTRIEPLTFNDCTLTNWAIEPFYLNYLGSLLSVSALGTTSVAARLPVRNSPQFY